MQGDFQQFKICAHAVAAKYKVDSNVHITCYLQRDHVQKFSMSHNCIQVPGFFFLKSLLACRNKAYGEVSFQGDQAKSRFFDISLKLNTTSTRQVLYSSQFNSHQCLHIRKHASSRLFVNVGIASPNAPS